MEFSSIRKYFKKERITAYFYSNISISILNFYFLGHIGNDPWARYVPEERSDEERIVGSEHASGTLPDFFYTLIFSYLLKSLGTPGCMGEQQRSCDQPQCGLDEVQTHDAEGDFFPFPPSPIYSKCSIIYPKIWVKIGIICISKKDFLHRWVLWTLLILFYKNFSSSNCYPDVITGDIDNIRTLFTLKDRMSSILYSKIRFIESL